MRRDVLDTFLNMVRDPGDDAARPEVAARREPRREAAHARALRRLRRRRRRDGLGGADPAVRAARSRAALRSFPTASGASREYIDMPGANAKVELTAIKEGDTLTYDFTGSSPQVELGVNCSYWATWGGLFAPIFPLLAWDVTWNEGVTRPDQADRARGDDRQLHPAGADLDRDGRHDPDRQQPLDARALEDLRRQREATRTARPRSGTAATRTSRPTASRPTGEFFVAPLTDTFCGAAGARAFADGVDMGGEIPNIVSRWANAESQELNTPIRYLFRRAVPDSGGPGKYRGGVCHEYAFTPNGRRTGRARAVRQGHARADEPRHLRRLSGLQRGLYDLPRRPTSTSLPDRLDEMQRLGAVRPVLGDARPRTTAMSSTSASWAGGGYGDPIDRDPELVLKDVLAGLVTDEPARDIYGVVIVGPARWTPTRRRRGGGSCAPSGSADPSTAPTSDRRRRARASGWPSTSSARRATLRSARGAATRSLRRGRTGRTTPSCAACPSRRPGRNAPRRASSS